MGPLYYYRALITLLVAVALVFAIGSWRPAPISSTVLKEKFWADKVHGRKKYPVVFAGDSRVYRGVDPETLKNELGGLSVLNYGFSSAGFNDLMFREISHRLDTASAKRVVILGITPYSLTPKAQRNSHILQEKDRPWDEVFSRRFIAPFLNYFDPIKPEDLINYKPDAPGYYEDFMRDGWVASEKIPKDPEFALKSYITNFEQNTVSDTVVNNLVQQVREWRSEGIILFALRMPSTEKMEHLEDSLSGFKEGVIRSKLTAAGGIWLDVANRNTLDSYDGSHLSRTAAKAFTKSIGEEIQMKLKAYQTAD